MKNVILAVDAGGSKTKLALIDKDMNIVYQIVGGCASPVVLKYQALDYILELIKQVINDTSNLYNIIYIEVGVSGLGIINNYLEYQELFAKETNIKVSLVNDVTLALHSVIKNKYQQGIVVLSGTGSAVYGVNSNCYELYGGYGHLLTEDSSSYAAVKMLLINIIKEYEEKRTISKLHKKFLEVLNIKRVEALKGYMYFHNKTEIASFAHFLSENINEEEIKEIYDNIAINLVKAIRMCYIRLNLSCNAVVGFRGSFICNAPYVKEKVISLLEKENIKYIEEIEYCDPIYGAYYLLENKSC